MKGKYSHMKTIIAYIIAYIIPYIIRLTHGIQNPVLGSLSHSLVVNSPSDMAEGTKLLMYTVPKLDNTSKYPHGHIMLYMW